MTLLSDNWVLNILSVFLSFIVVFVVWINWTHTYWQKRGLKVPPKKFLFGHTTRIFTQKDSFTDLTTRLYNYFKDHNIPHGGLYMMFIPLYMPVDPIIIKHILQNDFEHFMDRGVYINEKSEPLSAHLFSLEGEKWRNLRMKLTPTFTSGKMKMMFDTLVKCGDELTVEMNKTLGQGPIDAKEILMRFTMDIIGNCAFGIECNSLKNPDNEFSRYMKLFFLDEYWDNIKGFVSFVAPTVMRKLGHKAIKPKLSEFFMRVLNETVEYREKNNVYRKDFMHLLLQLKNKGRLDDVLVQNNDKDENVKLTMDELAAQAFIFFLAGFETSSTTMSFALYELASNPDIQRKLREEVNIILKKRNNQLTYDAIMEMHYLDKVFNETLRKYPPLPALFRMCTKEYKIPGTDIVIEKGTKVCIPVVGLQHDPDYYPDPEIFDPERFSEENKNTRRQCTFLPFGEGPRICIGLRFGMMQTKVGLSILLKNYEFSVSRKTILPFKFDPRSFVMATKGGIWLDYKQI